MPTRAPPAADRAPVGNGAAVSAELARYLADEQDRIARGINNVVIRRIFAAGLDLQAALAMIGDHRGAGKISHAIDELDQAIRDIRNTIFGHDSGEPRLPQPRS
jgi:signal transduction histidine kinase